MICSVGIFGDGITGKMQSDRSLVLADVLTVTLTRELRKSIVLLIAD
jgi:hypothetical protein